MKKKLVDEIINDFIYNYNKDFDKNSVNVKCLCGSNQSKRLFYFDRYIQKSPTVVCKNCGLIYSNPRLNSIKIAEYYSSDLYRFLYEGNFVYLDQTKKLNLDDYKKIYNDEFISRNRIYNRLFTLIKNEKNLKILSIGPGHSFELLPFGIHGKLFGLDYSPKICDLGKEINVKMIQGGIDKLKNFSEKFDIIIMSHVVEHLYDFKKDFNEILKITNPQCYIYIEVPCMDYKYSLDQIQNAHNYYFTKNTLLKYLNELNLKPVILGVADKIHIYGIFKISKKINKQINLEKEYKKIIKKHNIFKKKFYNKYIINIYIRYYIKIILGKKIVKLIKKINN